MFLVQWFESQIDNNTEFNNNKNFNCASIESFHSKEKLIILYPEKSHNIPKHEDKVAQVIGNCAACIADNAKTVKNDVFLIPIDNGYKPFVTYNIDHVGPMEVTRKK